MLHVFKKPRNLHAFPAYPESLRHLRNAARALRLAQGIDDGPFLVAGCDGLLLRDPHLRQAEEIPGLTVTKRYSCPCTERGGVRIVELT